MDKSVCDTCYHESCPLKLLGWIKAHEVKVSSCNVRENYSVWEARQKRKQTEGGTHGS